MAADFPLEPLTRDLLAPLLFAHEFDDNEAAGEVLHARLVELDRAALIRVAAAALVLSSSNIVRAARLEELLSNS
ncbi:MAG: hypothetical protein DI534_09750 [Leifsonia xyli]|nr:MAG: hypothetical protein DI534_09750 [Leifsonia xyli]